MQSNINKSNRLDALLALRGFACLMVVTIHCAPPRKSIIYDDIDLSWLMFSHGAIAVWILFVLSGYLMGKVFYTKRYTVDIAGVIKFWRNRVLRIFPLYYFAVLVLSIFVYPEILKFTNWGYLFRICTFTYHPYISFETVKFNDVFWSLSTEIQFYLIVPFIYSLIHHRLSNQKKVFIAGFLIIIASLIFRSLLWISFNQEITQDMGYAFKYWYTPLITNLDLFLCGFLVNELIQNHKFKLNYNKSLIIKILSAILIILLYLFTAHHLYHQELWNLPNRSGGWRTLTTILILQPLTAIITSFFIFAFDKDVYQEFGKNEKLSCNTILKNPTRILEIIGNLSYGIYIWHMPIITRTYDVFNAKIPIEAFYIRLTATILLSTVLATVTYYLVELPFAKWKRK
ncbi:putative acyltransferase [Rivularia sp. PCC 7116]|uniref:acyltransferase family protein n=1 Tax=Rivularia sp. PCC 7116 TaxID=373994 RepID=UPI00029F036C|nr:acyltransferase [Rivularia sp. PCC 7116]AFY55664.1 putative acyltransferase [Rivularia sp. PCC 7116]